jgi:DNA modification methylase
LSGEAWGVRETGELLGQSKSHIGLATFVAGFLHANDQEVWRAVHLADAYRIITLRKQKEAERLLAAQVVLGTIVQPPTTPKVAPIPTPTTLSDDELFSGGVIPFAPNIVGPTVDDTPAGTVPVKGTTIPLSKMLIRANVVDYLQSCPDETFDHIITDWPYGVDLEHMNVGNIHGPDGPKWMADVEGEHQVAENEALHAAVVPLFFRVLRPGGFFITWTDMMQWQRGYDLAIAAGFKVQRWSLIWLKTSRILNQCSQYNFSKNYEIAMVCRKGNATLISPQVSSVWTGGADAEVRALGHPFAKPFGLWNWLYDAVTVGGAHVLEPFAGRGSAVIPAIRRGLRITAVESNETHYNALVVNISNLYLSLDPNTKFT